MVAGNEEDIQDQAAEQWGLFKKVSEVLADTALFEVEFRNVRDGEHGALVNELVPGMKGAGPTPELTPTTILTQEPQNRELDFYLDQADKAAELLEEVVENLVQEICKRMGKDDYGNDPAEYFIAPMKSEERCREKAELDYKGDYARILDYCRCSLVMPNLDVIRLAIKLLATVKEWWPKAEESGLMAPGPGTDEDNFVPPLCEICRVKNLFKTTGNNEDFIGGGYRDVKVNVRLGRMAATKKTGLHLVEIQLHLRPFFDIKTDKTLGVHEHYEFARTRLQGFTDAMQLVERLSPTILEEMSILAQEEKEAAKAHMAPAAPQLLTICNNASQVLMARSQFAAAELELREAIENSEKAGLGDSVNAKCIFWHLRNNLAVVLTEQGKFEEAQRVLSESIRGCSQDFGPGPSGVEAEALHPSVFALKNNQANLYNAMAKYDLAEKMHLENWQDKQKIFIPNHPDILASLNNLCTVWVAQGRNDDAVEKLHETLKACDTVFDSPGHPSVLVCKNNLATALKARNEIQAAEKILELAVFDAQRHLGESHATTLTLQTNLADCLAARKEYHKAEDLMKKVLSAREKQFGQTHLATAAALNNLAQLCQEQHRLEESQEYLERAYQAKLEAFGAKGDDGSIYRIDNPSLLVTLNNLATLYRAKREHSRAEKELKEALSKHRLGESHPSVLCAKNNLAAVYYEQKMYKEAAVIAEDVQKNAVEILGPEHPSTIRYGSNLKVIRAACV